MNTHSHGAQFFYFFLFLIVAGYGWQANASVTMTGTRIIYNGAAKSTDVQLKNKDNFPYVITTWFDNGNMSDGPEKSAAVPFVATPPVFRIQPNDGQIIRLVFTNSKSLPQDRESLFWFNFMQVPPANISQAQNAGDKPNSILIMLRNRVKLFYRPQGLSANPQKMLENLRVARVTQGQKVGISITNDQPYYVTIAGLTLTGTAGAWHRETDMIAPFSSESFFFSGARASGMKSVRITLVNDQGARISEDYPL
ncbi:fimbria/pilus periplasmic chaperone [Entomohabitans teleogrylli]|uniref:fimbria/pilus periplasmic chaperone n=1 Tax=Entomohabitans teleogrylli TaxID=1384589 RepID=UPI00073D7E97|nr:fimbria/pilus periplasmic chaperone [Entomohabitans teleogrylli]